MRCSAASVTSAQRQRRSRTACASAPASSASGDATVVGSASAIAACSLSHGGSKSRATRQRSRHSSDLNDVQVWCAAVRRARNEAARARFATPSHRRRCGASSDGLAKPLWHSFLLSALAFTADRPRDLSARKEICMSHFSSAAAPRRRGAVAASTLGLGTRPGRRSRSPSACCCPARAPTRAGWNPATTASSAAQKKHGDKIKVQMIENISNADMEQALTDAGAEEQAGHRHRRPDAGGADEGRQALPEGQVRDHRRQPRREPAQRQRLRRQAGARSPTWPARPRR